MNITADDYLEKLVEYCNMKIYAIATVTETRQTWADEDDFQVIKPPIQIKVSEWGCFKNIVEMLSSIKYF